PSITASSRQNAEGSTGPLPTANCQLPTAPCAVAHLSVESLNPDDSFADLANITAGLRSPSGTVTTTLLTQTSPGRYEADVPVGEPGAYEVRLTQEGSATGLETAG